VGLDQVARLRTWYLGSFKDLKLILTSINVLKKFNIKEKQKGNGLLLYHPQLDNKVGRYGKPLKDD